MSRVDVRDLRGEDLVATGWPDERGRLRCLGEASAVASRTEDLDVLAACAGDDVVGIGAVGHGTGGASLVSLWLAPGCSAGEVAPRLMDSLEHRAEASSARRVRVHVDAHDEGARTLFEQLGYELVGAGTLSWPDGAEGGGHAGGRRCAVRHVDCWVLHKALDAPESD